ncbi:hypothetical protein [Methanobrevibacter intestini]|uniref:hypothetical protein n=1 Tax=Methanobrevibacter intestini TaxID=2911853 RepID=UPI003CFD2125
MRNTLYDQARKEGIKEGKTEIKNEITNEITTLIQKGKLPKDTLDKITSLKT